LQESVKGRGAQLNPHNRFSQHQVVAEPEYQEYLYQTNQEDEPSKTEYINVQPKSIVNGVDSPDLKFAFSMNPYQGCEHGCVYCYARNTHEYWGYSAGMDFEQKILVKANSVELLREKLSSKRWNPAPIMLSGNTDCYQPIERKLKITRKILEVFLKYRHPVGLITKNALVLRDLDILTELAKLKLVKVVISITSLDDKLRRVLEPRTSSVQQKLKAIETLSSSGIPTMVMMAPIIPGLNSHEIMDMAKLVADRGATAMAYTMIRLNGVLPEIFTDWLRLNFPDRAEKVLHQIEEVHGGTLGDSRFKLRMSGEGPIARHIADLFAIARKRFNLTGGDEPFDLSLFRRPEGTQMSMF